MQPSSVRNRAPAIPLMLSRKSRFTCAAMVRGRLLFLCFVSGCTYTAESAAVLRAGWKRRWRTGVENISTPAIAKSVPIPEEVKAVAQHQI
jgi:hypothetical protein